MEATGNEDPRDASKNWVRPKDENFRSGVTNNRYGEWAKNKTDKTYAHEIGHMLGLADQYVDVEFDPESNYMGKSGGLYAEDITNPAKDELMATAKGYEGREKVSQRDINAISKYALDRKKTGKVILDRNRLVKDGYNNGLAAPTDKDIFRKNAELNMEGKKVVINPDNK